MFVHFIAREGGDGVVTGVGKLRALNNFVPKVKIEHVKISFKVAGRFHIVPE
jgi:hypothetical protein